VTPGSVLVTGASGFLGAAAVAASRSAWPQALVTGADLRGADVVCDLADQDAASALLREFRPDAVLHLAGSTAGSDLDGLRRANVEPLQAVLAAVATYAPTAMVVVPGSAAEYGEADPAAGPLDESAELRPLSPYGIVKAEQTMLAQRSAAAGSCVVVGRIFNLCGAGSPERLLLGGVAAQLRRIAAGEQEAVVRTGDLSAVRDFIDVGDACRALLAMAESGSSGEVYNVSTETPTVAHDAVRTLIELSGTGAQHEVRHTAPARGNVPWSVGANAKLRRATGWRPRTSLRDSLAAMLA
jgi:nucleoside-diphosphate-sugar epimerase